MPASVERHQLRPRHLVVQGVGQLLAERLVHGDDLQAQPLGGVGGRLAELELVRHGHGERRTGGSTSSSVGWVESPAS